MRSLNKILIAGAMAMGAGFGGVEVLKNRNEDYQPSFFPKGKTKPKSNGSNTLRGYYARYSHVLSPMVADQNLAKKANGKTGFKGFRKVRKFIPSGNLYLHPNQGMSFWFNA